MTLSRTIRAFLLAALALGATSQIAQAEQRSPQQTAEHDRICRELKDAYDTNMDYYNGNPAKRGKWKITAENLKTLAEGNNCSWAAARIGPAGLGVGPADDLDVAPPNGKTQTPLRAPLGSLAKFN
jgi:hypothetical protein